MSSHAQAKMMTFFFLSLFLDQSTKLLAHSFGWVTLNTGISFGLLSVDQQYLLVALSGSGFAFLSLFFQQFWRENLIWYGLCTGAVFSNIVDRVVWGGVQDFLPIPLTNIQNNLADWFITATLVYLAFTVFTQQRREKTPSSS